MIHFESAPSQATHYETLGVSPQAELSEIKRRYRELARAAHPDLQIDAETRLDMAEINRAYHVLSDPELRAEYDRALSARDRDSATSLDDARVAAVNVSKPLAMRAVMALVFFALIGVMTANLYSPHQRRFNREFKSAETLFKPHVDRALRGDLPSLEESLQSPQGALMREMINPPLSPDTCLSAFPDQLRRVETSR